MQFTEKLQKVQNSDARDLVNKIVFHPTSELFTGCLSKHVLGITISYKIFVTLFPPGTAHVYLSDLLYYLLLIAFIRHYGLLLSRLDVLLLHVILNE